MKKLKDLPECPVATTVSLIGSKWKLLIIRNLMSRPWRFNELQRSLGATQKSLTDALRSLEDDRLVARKVYPEIPPKVEYSMTELGKSLWPTIESMQKFGEYYKEQS
ncbi:helix-turn-helix transcriptional regulator [Candidatus Saccharibacteria bacterium]|nr:helix-turn-helix transcriptional regulator [Candidatus Saccharibacteria bacterium]